MTEILRVGESDGGPDTLAQRRLGDGDRVRHLGRTGIVVKLGWAGGDLHNHPLRPYSRGAGATSLVHGRRGWRL